MSKNENNDDCSIAGKVIFFATGNIHKFNEAKSILRPLGYALAMLKMKGDEIQSENIQYIAQVAVINAYRRSHLPIFVEDAGLFIEALEGFPGPYAAYAYKTIHNSGVLKLMGNLANRRAKFQSAVAYLDQNQIEPKIFMGECSGTITQTERVEQGKSGFGFDPIFQPKGSSKTFAEMAVQEKNVYSHRAAAIRKFAAWHQKRLTTGK